MMKADRRMKWATSNAPTTPTIRQKGQSELSGQRQSSTSLAYDDLAIVKSVGGVVGTSVDQAASQTVKADGVNLDDANLVGTTPDFPSVRDLDIDAGRFFTDKENDRGSKIAILGASLAEELFGEETAVGQSITVDTAKLTIISEATGLEMLDIQSQLRDGESLAEIITGNGADLDTVKSALQETLAETTLPEGQDLDTFIDQLLNGTDWNVSANNS